MLVWKKRARPPNFDRFLESLMNPSLQYGLIFTKTLNNESIESLMNPSLLWKDTITKNNLHKTSVNTEKEGLTSDNQGVS